MPSLYEQSHISSIPHTQGAAGANFDLADAGYELTLAKSVNDLLMAIYDTLEDSVHRTLARDRHILHRDMSIFNVLMCLGSASCTNDISRDAPPLIDDVLQGELRSPEKRTARCLVIDFDNAASLGTPAYVARAVASGSLFTTESNLKWLEKMPELSGETKALYTKLYGEDRYIKYLDTHDTIHGGVPPRETVEETEARALGMTFFFRREYDAESIFWTMYAALLRVVPKASPKESEDSREALNENWKMLYEHTIPRGRRTRDSRNPLVDQSSAELRACLLPAMQDVALLIKSMARHVYPTYAVMTPPPPLEDHLHEAMQRLILQYLVDHRDNPIPLVPGKLRPVSVNDNPVINQHTYGASIPEEQPRVPPKVPQ
ncbi:hypothetical protein FKP32DRAFT_1600158 [Trametes sanguinea]|nr:hypothetical protein FKP32DRAFT_1600158 [Trametes sanguinea]